MPIVSAEEWERMKKKERRRKFWIRLEDKCMSFLSAFLLIYSVIVAFLVIGALGFLLCRFIWR